MPGDRGVFVEGAWDGRGAHTSPPGTFTYSCLGGVIAKCVAWGYAPWRVGAERHAACTRLARVDYCGDGNPWTLDGTTIGLSDAVVPNCLASLPACASLDEAQRFGGELANTSAHARVEPCGGCSGGRTA